MKFLFCKECNSLFNLSHNNKSCECGKVSGKYIGERKAVYCGKQGVRLGVDNKGIAKTIIKRNLDLYSQLEASIFKIDSDVWFTKLTRKKYKELI